MANTVNEYQDYLNKGWILVKHEYIDFIDGKPPYFTELVKGEQKVRLNFNRRDGQFIWKHLL